MTRQALTDGSGRWFDTDKAEAFAEGTWWNGSNHVSRATSSQFEHEVLYRTAGGRWIVYHWSQWQGSSESWVEIDDKAAAAWLVVNELEPHKVCAEEFAALEIR